MEWGPRPAQLRQGAHGLTDLERRGHGRMCSQSMTWVVLRSRAPSPSPKLLSPNPDLPPPMPAGCLLGVVLLLLVFEIRRLCIITMDFVRLIRQRWRERSAKVLPQSG